MAVEAGAGDAAQISDDAYRAAGADVVTDRAELWATADIVFKVRAPSAEEVGLLRKGQVLVSFIWPAQNPELMQQLAARGATVLAMDSVPRISRAQKLDALSSMANIGGYRAVIEAAHEFGRFFTGSITAAGKVPPAKVFVIGAGVAGLAAIGAASGLGAIVRANDTRPEVADQIKSLGGEYVGVDYVEEGSGVGGYAKVMSEGFQKAQREVFAKQAKDVDIIITTALIPGKPAPKLITEDMVKSMKQGSVIVDMAAEQGGNCELTVPGEVVVRHGVTIVGYKDLPSRLAKQASTLYATNLFRLMEDMIKTKSIDGDAVKVDMADEVLRGTTVINQGEVTWPPPPPKLSAAPPAVAKPAAVVPKAEGPWRAERPDVRHQDGGAVRRRRAGLPARRPLCAAVVPRSLHRVRARLLRRLHGGVEREARAAHAAHERDQRSLQHHRHRRAGADRAGSDEDLRRPLAPERVDTLAVGGRDRARHDQHVRRLRRDPAHAADVPQVRATIMTSSLSTVSYIGATILFILCLGGLSNQETSRRGNLYGMIGMAIAVIATIFGAQVTPHGLPYIIGAMVVGAAIGLYVARMVQMTQMPELVAFMHSLVGLAAMLVGYANFIDPVVSVGLTPAENTIHEIEMYLGVLIGAVTFSGSVIAFGKLSARISGKPVLLPGRHLLNLAGLLAVLYFGYAFVNAHSVSEAMTPMIVMTVIALLFGVHMVMAIGGADMPVVVSMLNSYSGWAAAATGFMLNNDLLIVTGALVGSSGAILSYIMCKAMNRNFISVIAGGFGTDSGAAAPAGAVQPAGEVNPILAAETAEMLKDAKNVIIVPGYGMAVAQAQHTVNEITQALRSNAASTCASASIRSPDACRDT